MAVLPPISKSCHVMSSVDRVICYLLLIDSNIINTHCIMISGVARPLWLVEHWIIKGIVTRCS